MDKQEFRLTIEIGEGSDGMFEGKLIVDNKEIYNSSDYTKEGAIKRLFLKMTLSNIDIPEVSD